MPSAEKALSFPLGLLHTCLYLSPPWVPSLYSGGGSVSLPAEADDSLCALDPFSPRSSEASLHLLGLLPHNFSLSLSTRPSPSVLTPDSGVFHLNSPCVEPSTSSHSPKSHPFASPPASPSRREFSGAALTYCPHFFVSFSFLCPFHSASTLISLLSGSC